MNPETEAALAAKVEEGIKLMSTHLCPEESTVDAFLNKKALGYHCSDPAWRAANRRIDEADIRRKLADSILDLMAKAALARHREVVKP